MLILVSFNIGYISSLDDKIKLSKFTAIIAPSLHSPLPLHLGEADVDLDFFLGRQFLLDI